MKTPFFLKTTKKKQRGQEVDGHLFDFFLFLYLCAESCFFQFFPVRNLLCSVFSIFCTVGRILFFSFFFLKLRGKKSSLKGLPKVLENCVTDVVIFQFFVKKRARDSRPPPHFSSGKYKKYYHFFQKNEKRPIFGKKYSFKSSIAKLKGGLGRSLVQLLVREGLISLILRTRTEYPWKEMSCGSCCFVVFV